MNWNGDTVTNPKTSASATSLPFPADVYGVKRLGVETWRAAWDWPIHWQSFVTFHDGLMDIFDTLLAAVNGEERDVVMATADIIGTIREVLHADAVRRHAASCGRELLLSPLSKPYYDPDFAQLADPRRQLVALDINGLTTRALARRYMEARHLGLSPLIASLTGRATTWSLGTMGGLKREYLLRNPQSLRPVYAESYIKPLANIPTAELPPRLDSAIAEARSSLRQLSANVLGSDAKVDALVSAWRGRLGVLLAIFRAVKLRMEPGPDRLLVNEVAKPWNRLMALAARSLGREVVLFNHGHDFGVVLERAARYLHYPHGTSYVSETPSAAAGHAARYGNSGPARYFPVNFEWLSPSPLYRSSPAPATGGQIKRAMVIGYPHLASRNQYDVFGFFAFLLDAELAIVERLQSLGMEPQYKAHPEAYQEVSGIFEAAGATVLPQPFSVVHKDADAFIFLHTATTTFVEALATGKPLIVLRSRMKKLNPAFADDLATRCRLVPAELSDANRIAIDWNEFDAAVRRADPPDLALLERIMDGKTP